MKSTESDGKKKVRVPGDDGGFFDKLEVQFLIHELKDPIAVIETGARAMLERTDKYGPISDRQEKTLKRILRNTRKAREMLYDLLEVGRSEAGFCISCRFQPVRVTHEVLMETLDALSKQVPKEFRTFSASPGLTDFLSDLGIRFVAEEGIFNAVMLQDETKFRQIVGNLIKNALHHRQRRLEIRLEKTAQQMLCVRVTDDGPGVDPKHHQLIFERYAQVNECVEVDRKGHGLGLAGALALARCLGGSVDIDSRKGQGATFNLTLPMTLGGADTG